MRALRVLVVVMGVMIVAGIAVLAATIVGRVTKPRPAASVSPPPLDLPHGARIETIGVGPDRVVLAIARPDGGRELVVLDLASGRKLMAVPLRDSP
jgi:hypothetical protein